MSSERFFQLLLVSFLLSIAGCETAVRFTEEEIRRDFSSVLREGKLKTFEVKVHEESLEAAYGWVSEEIGKTLSQRMKVLGLTAKEEDADVSILFAPTMAAGEAGKGTSIALQIAAYDRNTRDNLFIIRTRLVTENEVTPQLVSLITLETLDKLDVFKQNAGVNLVR